VKDMVGIMDVNDDKNTIEDIERDKEIIRERLYRAQFKKEIATEMLEHAKSDMTLAKYTLDNLERQSRKLRERKDSK